MLVDRPCLDNKLYLRETYLEQLYLSIELHPISRCI